MGIIRCFFLLVLIALLPACDEFMLRKTVAVEHLSGDITFDPGTPTLSGVLTYTIRNNQSSPLSEVYFISHALVSLDYAAFEGDTVRFEQGVGYGYGIYRIRIPQLPRGQKAKIDLRFHVDGPVEDDRFVLTRDNVFLDAEKIWLPVPFAQKPLFSFDLRIRTPEAFYSVLGAKLSGESTNGGKRISDWASEMNDVVLTGNIFISRFQRIRKTDSLFLYVRRSENSELVSRLVTDTLSVFRDRIGRYPFSQVHLIAEIFQYRDMEEFIDGESIGNIIQVSPDLITNALLPDAEVTGSVSPDIPRNSFWKTAEAVNHELGHAYIRGILKFEDEDFIDSESLTEYLGLTVISLTNQAVYGKFIDRNRVELINLGLAGKMKSKLFRYLYGVNCLHSAFDRNSVGFFAFLTTLLEKYGYTHIQVAQLLSTGSEMNFILTNRGADTNGTGQRLIETGALKLWNDGRNELGNIRLSLSNIWVTNFLSKKKFAVEQKILLTIANEFPVDVPVTLAEYYKNRSETNSFLVAAGEETSIMVDRNILSAAVESRYGALEKSLSDNTVQLHANGENARTLAAAIQAFYRNELLPDNVLVEKTKPDAGGWRSLQSDRQKSMAVNSDIRIQADDYRENDRKFSLAAYKWIAGRPYSYVVFRGKLQAKRRVLTAVIDPALE